MSIYPTDVNQSLLTMNLAGGEKLKEEKSKEVKLKKESLKSDNSKQEKVNKTSKLDKLDNYVEDHLINLEVGGKVEGEYNHSKKSKKNNNLNDSSIGKRVNLKG